MAELDYYRILGVDSSATRSDIRRAFRLLAMRYHPDQNRDNPSAEERFKLITQAYKVLIDTKKRVQYDRRRQAAQAQRRREATEAHRRAAANHRAGSTSGFDAGDSGYGRSFASTGTAARQGRKPWWQQEMEKTAPPRPSPPPRPKTQPVKDRNLYVDMTVSREMAELGGRQPLAISREVTCPVCEGNGAKPGTTIRPCPECADKPSSKCPYCSGRGQIIQAFCPECHGSGKVRETKTIVVTVPALTKNGQTIRVPGEGMKAEGDVPGGDLVVHLRVKEVPDYEERDSAVYSEIHITPAMAAMGGTVRVKTIDSVVDLIIPPGTQPGTVFKLEGVGPKISENVRGDHYVTVQIVSV